MSEGGGTCVLDVSLHCRILWLMGLVLKCVAMVKGGCKRVEGESS